MSQASVGRRAVCGAGEEDRWRAKVGAWDTEASIGGGYPALGPRRPKRSLNHMFLIRPNPPSGPSEPSAQTGTYYKMASQTISRDACLIPRCPSPTLAARSLHTPSPCPTTNAPPSRQRLQRYRGGGRSALHRHLRARFSTDHPNRTQGSGE